MTQAETLAPHFAALHVQRNRTTTAEQLAERYSIPLARARRIVEGGGKSC
jgi:hypothetical protein